MAEMRSVNRFLNYLNGGRTGTVGQQFHFRCFKFQNFQRNRTVDCVHLTVIESKNDINRKNVVTIK